jgi:hypothetical protein
MSRVVLTTEGPVRVKTGKPQSEQILSAMHRKRTQETSSTSK